MTASLTPARAGGRQWLGLAVLALPTLLLSIDVSVLHLAVPHLAADLDPSGTQLLWILDIYAFLIAGFLITMGTLGDRIGRRRLLLVGGLAFGVASVVAAYSTSAEMLIAARAALGVAGATLMPSTLALIRNMFLDSRQRGFAIAVWMSAFTGGVALGPVVGGVLLQWFWWGSVFLLGVPVMALLLVVGPLVLPEYRGPTAERLDALSALLSLAAILPLVYGLKGLAGHGFGAEPLAGLAVGAVFGVVFVRRQLRLTDPLLDLGLFADRGFSSALGVMLGSTLAMGGMFMLVAQYLQLVGELSPLSAGLVLVPPSIVMIASTMVAPALAHRLGHGLVVGVGMVVAALGFGILTQVDPSGAPALVVVGQIVVSAGVGPGMALLAGIVIGSVPKERAGSAAAISETSGELGAALGVALLGSLATAVYRAQVVVPDGAPPEVAAAAQDGMSAAAAASDGLPTPLGDALLLSAREAFTQGMSVTLATAAGATLLLGIVSIVVLRHVTPAEHDDTEEASTADTSGATTDTR
ncbi:MFS transporter [Spiractinospora alimapuensis]|uniref:MFS transporter n=1 Tax=Spiractinospora alimapuensis TaxID=2820884 RepID=UPI001F38BA1F|nr:MFS transporter [Spiractinospora alimapuensis]QVQ52455.1 MFS transporter [Spiractinospora alimapuensis]